MNEDRLMNEYRNILGISSPYSLPEIKKAYRKRAKELHPDVNPAPDAQKQFCLLNEAYDYFVTTSKNAVSTDDWFSDRYNARNRTKKYAEMHYNQFVDSEFYQTSESVNTLFDFVVVILLFLGLIGMPILAFIYSGAYALSFVLFIILITSKGWLSILRSQKKSVNDREIQSAFVHLFKKSKSYVIIASMINFLILTHTFGHTFITPKSLFGIYFLAFLSGFLISLIMQSSFLKTIMRWAVFPSLASLFFILNYTFSSAPTKEVYLFHYTIEKVGNTQEQTSLLILEGNHYQEYPGIRFVFNVEQTASSRYVQYIIEKGLFNIPVLKEYSFSLEKELK